MSSTGGLQPLTEADVRRLGPVRRWFAARPVAADVLVVLVVAVLSLGSLVTLAVPGANPAGVVPADRQRLFVTVQVVAAVLGLAAIAVRRRWPVLVAAVIAVTVAATVATPIGLGLPAGDAALPFALYAVAANRRPPVAWGTFVAVLLVLTGGFALGPGTQLPAGAGASVSVGSDGGTTTIDDFSWGPFSAQDLSALAAYLVVGLVFLSIGLSVFSRRERVAHLVRRSHELVALGEQQARLASMQERSRIAREMHDIVAHSLSVMIALSDGARASVTRAPTAADEALDLLSQTGRSALADMRRMLGVLREGSEPQVEPGLVTPALPRPAPGADQVPDPGGPAGSDLAAEPARAMDPDLTAPTGPVAEVDLPTAPQPTEGADLDVLVDRFRRAGLPVRYRAAELPEHDGLRLAVYRVLQESLTNTLRHVVGAGAVDVVVAVVAARATVPARVVVTVTDDGGSHLPAARTPGPGRGLVGLQERAALFEGTASAGPYRGGWRVRVELVVPQDAGPRPSLVWRLPA